MKKRIEQLLNGKFEYEVPKLKLSQEEIRLEARPGEVLHGSFQCLIPGKRR